MNNTRMINRGVRAGKKTYTAGMEDELAKVLSTDEVKRLSKKGHIEGSWTSPTPKTDTKTSQPVDEDLNELTVAELKDRAREAQVEGFSTMNKADLVTALGNAKE